jgi:hypothetical protein
MTREDVLISNFRIFVLKATGGNRAATARILGTSQRTIARFCRAHGIELPASRPPAVAPETLALIEARLQFEDYV